MLVGEEVGTESGVGLAGELLLLDMAGERLGLDGAGSGGSVPMIEYAPSACVLLDVVEKLFR